MESQGQSCAHKRVVHTPTYDNSVAVGLVTAERWLCDSCGCEFVSKQLAQREYAKLKALAALAEEANRAARSDALGEHDPETGASYPVDWHDWIRRYDEAIHKETK